MNSRHRKNKIVYITLNGRIPSNTANSVGVMTMCGQYAKQGFDVLLLIPGSRGECLSKYNFTGDVFSFYNVVARFKIKRYFNYPSRLLYRLSFLYSFFLVRYAKSYRASLIVTRDIQVAVWAARLKIPVVLESHNFPKFASHWLIKSWLRIIQNSKSSVSMVVTTKAGMNSYVDIGVPDKKIQVYPNGVNVSKFQTEFSQETIRDKTGLPHNKTIATFSGSLQPGRGGDEILDCAGLLPEVCFALVGGSLKDVALYHQKSIDRGLENVMFTGHVAQEKLSLYILASDILLMPYTTNFSIEHSLYTSPMKMFEYLAAGKPIVATDFKVLHEVLHHKHNAFFVEPDSGYELARGIRYFLDNPVEAKNIALTAKNDAKKYDWEKRATSIIAWQKRLGYLE